MIGKIGVAEIVYILLCNLVLVRFHVLVMSAVFREALVTNLALVGSFPCVNPFMVCKVNLFKESFITKTAFQRSLADRVTFFDMNI